jgi:hypothetical protein
MVPVGSNSVRHASASTFLASRWIAIIVVAVLAAGWAANGGAEPPKDTPRKDTAVKKSPPVNLGAYLGSAHTSLYGIEAEGFKFVYVFDRSASMGNGPNTPLAAAKVELLNSLERLGPTHQFQIIFYNERPKVFSLAGYPGRIVYATDINKRQARSFVDSITADGGTGHLSALEMALSFGPDVVYFLTDAAEPDMSARDLARIRHKNQVSVIHTIEFGEGPAPDRENFLAHIARDNRGRYTYIDIRDLLSKR